MLSCFHLIPERYGRTGRRTDGQTDIISMLTRDKNWKVNGSAVYFLYNIFFL